MSRASGLVVADWLRVAAAAARAARRQAQPAAAERPGRRARRTRRSRRRRQRCARARAIGPATAGAALRRRPRAARRRDADREGRVAAGPGGRQSAGHEEHPVSSRGPRRWPRTATPTSSSRTRAARRRASLRQFLTPYGVEIVELPELQRVFIFDIGGPHTFRTVYMDGRSHPEGLHAHLLRPLDRLVGRRHAASWTRSGYNEGFWMDRGRPAAHEPLHTIEKFTRTDFNTMRYELHRGRPRRLHRAVHRRDEPAVGGRHGALRVPVPAGQLRPRADGGRVREGRSQHVDGSVAVVAAGLQTHVAAGL